MPTLECIVDGEKVPFSIDIEAHEKVNKLKDKIKEKKMFQFPAPDMDLYRLNDLVKTLNDKDEEEFWHNGEPIELTNNTFRSISGLARKMNEPSLISDYFNKENISIPQQIHVLLVCPLETKALTVSWHKIFSKQWFAPQAISWFDSLCDWYYRPRVAHNCKALISFLEGEMIQKDAIISSPHILQEESLQFRLTGREDAIETAMKCYTKIIEFSETAGIDRTKRMIPVCSGISGLGKTRMLEEGKLIVQNTLRRMGLEDEFNCIASIIVPYYNGYSPQPVENTMSIEASFSWRLLFQFFLAKNCLLSFTRWFRERLPSNGNKLTLELALDVIQYKLSESLGNPQRVYLFLGIDEYQKIEKVHAPPKNVDTSLLRELVETIGNILCLQSPKLVLLPMFAGTDLDVISSIANSSSFVTQRLPMSLLTIQQVFSFVQSAKEFAGFLKYSQVCRNLFTLGGVPRWVVDYLLELKRESNVLSLTVIENCYRNITGPYVASAFTLLNPRQRLRLAAFALSGRSVQPDELFDGKLTWARLRDSSLCLLSSYTPKSLIKNEISVPYSLFLQIEAPNSVSEEEISFVSALKDLFKFVDSKLFDILPWQSWEVFGACFYALRINALLVLGHSIVKFGDLLNGAEMDDATSNIRVKLAPSRVFRCAEQFGPTTGQILTQQGNTLETIDWITSGCIALNAEGGQGVDIFFALKHAVTDQVVVVVDQRKRQFGKFQPSQASDYLKKLSQCPTFLTNAILVRGVLNCVSVSNLASFTVPPHCFIVSREQNDAFHGSLSYHPACSPLISVNTANKMAIQSLFSGSDKDVDEIVEEILRKRTEPSGGFSTDEDLNSIIRAKKLKIELRSEFLEFSY